MSHQPTDCLSHIIGLSRNICNCFDDSKPYDASTSDSGLYLDELEGIRLNAIDAASDCEKGGLWDIMERSREQALLALKADVMADLLNKYKQKRHPFVGVIGESKFKNTLSINNTYSGVRIYCQNIISGKMTIKKIGGVFSQTGNIVVSLYNDQDSTPVRQWTFSVVANQLTWYTLPTVEVLDMNTEWAENPNYYLVYEVSNQPKDIKASCGCSSNHYHYYWNTSNPMFKSYEKARWSEYIMLTGVQGNTISDRENWGTSGYLNGLMLDVEFACKSSEIICKQNLDYEYNPLALTMAHAVRFRAGAILADFILSSPKINRFTMMDRESLSGKKNHYLKEYKERISWLTDQMNYKANDCFECKDFNEIIKVGIFS